MCSPNWSTISSATGITAVRFMDELFAMDKRRVLEFSKRIKDYGLQWFVSLHASIVDEDFGDVLDTMRDAGCVYIGWGVESINPTVLKSMDKKVTRPELATALAENPRAPGRHPRQLHLRRRGRDHRDRQRHHGLVVAPSAIPDRAEPASPLSRIAALRDAKRRQAALRSEDGIYFDDPSRNLTAIPNGRFQAMLHRIGIFPREPDPAPPACSRSSATPNPTPIAASITGSSGAARPAVP